MVETHTELNLNEYMQRVCVWVCSFVCLCVYILCVILSFFFDFFSQFITRNALVLLLRCANMAGRCHGEIAAELTYLTFRFLF